jgi:hypothetical protein
VIRPYIAETEIRPGRGVVQGSADNKVIAAEDGSGDFIGVYSWEANMTHDEGDQIGIALSGVVKVEAGGVVKVEAGGVVNAGKKAVLAENGRFVELENEEGVVYRTCGVFLESGDMGDYVDLIIERGVVFVPEGTGE